MSSSNQDIEKNQDIEFGLKGQSEKAHNLKNLIIGS